MKHKKILFSAVLVWVVILIFVSIASAANQTISYDATILTAPQNLTLNKTINDDFHIFPLQCLLNTSSSPSCSVSRTLDAGESYVQQSGQCDLKFTCEQEEQKEIEQVNHKIRFRFEKEGQTFKLTYLATNETRIILPDETPFIEPEFNFMCPSVGSTNSLVPAPINFTNEQFATYCLGPLYNIGNLMVSNNDILKIEAEKRAVCEENQKTLIRENEALKSRETLGGECNAKLQNCENEKTVLNNRIAQSEQEMADCKAENNSLSTWNLIMFLGILVVLALFFTRKTMSKSEVVY